MHLILLLATRGGWSFGLNYAVGLTWLDEPLHAPEPGTAWMAVAAMVVMVAYTLTRKMPLRAWWKLWRVRRKLLKERRRLLDEMTPSERAEYARKALEE